MFISFSADTSPIEIDQYAVDDIFWYVLSGVVL